MILPIHPTIQCRVFMAFPISRFLPQRKVARERAKLGRPQELRDLVRTASRNSCRTNPEQKHGGTVPYKAIFWGNIPLHRPYIGLIYGRYLQFRFLEWPLIQHHVVVYGY